jgi:hypothetical protein
MKMKAQHSVMTNIISAALLLVLLAAAAQAASFPNIDTAPNRQDQTFGTKKSPAVTGRDEATGDAVMGTNRPEKKPQRDYYENMLLTINPQVNATQPAPRPPTYVPPGGGTKRF